jgi:DnaJ like chaperone protein
MKWISGFLGWILFGPIGALIGFLLGMLSESSNNNEAAYSGDNPANDREWRQGQRNSFLMSLLILSSAVIKADGKKSSAEIAHLKNFIRINFSSQAAEDAERIVSELMTREIELFQVCSQIRSCMDYSQRLHLFHYLVSLANSDGMSVAERDILEVIANYIGLSRAETNSILATYRSDAEAAYQVLEIEPTSSNDEVRKAYRKLAIKYHPDKVATLGEDVQKSAEERFKKIQAAYDTICKERGI